MSDVEITWNGKEQAIADAQTATSTKFVECEAESVNFATTQNLYIEADNVNALKFLRETYAGKIGTIYIDPPYNTGSSLTYKNAYPHAEWASMILTRLLVARDLLSDDGIIAIAIDDAELHRLKLIADEVFGECNFLGTIITRSNPAGRGHSAIDYTHEYHIVYAKNAPETGDISCSRNGEREYVSIMRTGKNIDVREKHPLCYYPILVKDGKISTISDDEHAQIYDANTKTFNDDFVSKLREKYEAQGYLFILPRNQNGEHRRWAWKIDRIRNESDRLVYHNGTIKMLQGERCEVKSLWTDAKHSNITFGTLRVRDILGTSSAVFDYAKSLYTVRDIISMRDDKNGIVLDFFSGSGTTAHAVWELNLNDNGTRKFILVQIPAPCDDAKIGFKNICEIAKEYLRRAGQKILDDNALIGTHVDVGFKVLKEI